MNRLTVQAATKVYGNITVLSQVDFELRAGEIHALLGANGAGKSTLCKIIAGLIRPNGGAMRLDDQIYQPDDKQAAERAGVQIVQQELNLIPTLSIAENLRLSRLPSRWGVVRRGELRRSAGDALRRFGLDDLDPDQPVGALGVGHQQMVEIAAALDRNCRVLILDEPTAALTAAETDRLFDRLRRLRSEGVGIIYISHRLEEVREIADRMTVLRDGKFVATHDDLTTDQMVQLISGQDTSGEVAHVRHVRDAVALRVQGISGGIVRDVSFEVRSGERLGIAGLVGSGRTELLRLVFGADPARSGQIALRDGVPGKPFVNPRQAVAAGLAMVTEDRKHNGLLLTQSIRDNASLAMLGKRFVATALTRRSGEADLAQRMVSRLNIRCDGIQQRVGRLSGGNQQKVAVAKWLLCDADVFFFDEPTRGIDVAARRRIYALIDELAAAGKAIVIVSSDLEELKATCDRIGVLSAGRWMANFDRDTWRDEAIHAACFAGYVT